MELTHIRTVNGETPELTTARAALDEIQAVMTAGHDDGTEMYGSGSTYAITYADGRKVNIRPATPAELDTIARVGTEQENAELAAAVEPVKSAPEWRTLKGVDAPFDTYVWPSEYKVLRPTGDRRKPHGDRVTVVELTRDRFSNTGVLADGRTVNFGGVASRQWIATN